MIVKEKSCPSATVTVCLAGDLADARRSLRQQAMEEGLCVTVTEVDYVYTAGLERGVLVQLRNYPRFETTAAQLVERGKTVALRLMEDCCQNSAMVAGPTETIWFSRRPEDLKAG